MSELTLLVNSTDAALLNGSVAAPVAANGAVAGFSGVLNQRLMQSESATKEAPPQRDAVRTVPVPVTETGRPQPVNGKPLPFAASQNTAYKPEAGDPLLDASLLSVIAQGIPVVNGQATHTLPTATRGVETDVALTRPTLSQPATARPTIESNTPSVLNMIPNSQSSVINQQNSPQNNLQNISPALPTAAQDAQRATALPAMLGNFTTAQQVLVRADLHASKAHSLRADLLPAAHPLVMNAQQNNGLSNVLSGSHNPIGSTMRMDMFAAAMGAAMQAGVGAEQHLPTTSATSTTPVSLIATPALPDDASILSAGTPRLSGASGTGFLPTLAVSTPMSQPAWASELGQRVTWLANSELREAQLQLNPRSLGAVDVRIVYGPEQQLNVSFSAANPVVRDALDASLPRLREMFEQQGLHLADANISHESPAERERRSNMNDETLALINDRAVDEASMDAVSLRPLSARWMGEGMLDTYA